MAVSKHPEGMGLWEELCKRDACGGGLNHQRAEWHWGVMPKEEAHYIPYPLCQLVLARDYEELHPCRSLEPPGTASPIDLLHNQQTLVLWGSSGEDTCELPTHADAAESTAEPQG